MRLAQKKIVQFVAKMKGNTEFRNMGFAGLKEPIASRTQSVKHVINKSLEDQMPNKNYQVDKMTAVQKFKITLSLSISL